MRPGGRGVRAILKYPGSKWTLAERIVGQMPPHKFYLEPYFGSGAVFFNKEPSDYETINDLDGNVVNFFRVCRDRPDELARAVNLTPFAREEFISIQEKAAGEEIQLTGDAVEDARRFLVRCYQGFARCAQSAQLLTMQSKSRPLPRPVTAHLRRDT